jgi:outer membrane protein W
MKKILTLCAGIMLASATTTNAQTFSVGPEVSLGHSWISNLDNIKFKLLGSAGATGMYMLNRNMGVSATAAFSWEGFRTHIVNNENGALKGYTTTYNAEYLRLTPKFVYIFGEDAAIRPKVGIGPSVAWKYNEARWTNEYKQDAKELIGSGGNDDRVPEVFDQIDLGITADAGVSIRLSQNTSLNVGAAYYHGLVDVLDVSNRENENLRANIGLMFGLW